MEAKDSEDQRRIPEEIRGTCHIRKPRSDPESTGDRLTAYPRDPHPETMRSRRRKDISMKLNGSQILIECLKEQGVDTVFGYPGGAILNV